MQALRTQAVLEAAQLETAPRSRSVHLLYGSQSIESQPFIYVNLCILDSQHSSLSPSNAGVSAAGLLSGFEFHQFLSKNSQLSFDFLFCFRFWSSIGTTAIC
jgi:hypothetical protein